MLRVELWHVTRSNEKREEENEEAMSQRKKTTNKKNEENVMSKLMVCDPCPHTSFSSLVMRVFFGTCNVWVFSKHGVYTDEVTWDGRHSEVNTEKKMWGQLKLRIKLGYDIKKIIKNKAWVWYKKKYNNICDGKLIVEGKRIECDRQEICPKRR